MTGFGWSILDCALGGFCGIALGPLNIFPLASVGVYYSLHRQMPGNRYFMTGYLMMASLSLGQLFREQELPIERVGGRVKKLLREEQREEKDTQP